MLYYYLRHVLLLFTNSITLENNFFVIKSQKFHIAKAVILYVIILYVCLLMSSEFLESHIYRCCFSYEVLDAGTLIQ